MAGVSSVIELRGIGKTYRMGSLTVPALQGVDLTVRSGEMVAIMGPSGSGKSTLMNLLGCLDRPTAGEYVLAGQAVARLDDDALADVRNRMIGFIFQNYNLLPRLNALQNVELPLIYRGAPARQRRQQAMASLAAVGLADRVHHLPAQLSGGQQQRVAIARALAGQPQVLLADEPTGNLDSHSGAEVMALMQELNDQGVTVVMVTHDERIALHCKRTVRVFDGRILADEAVAQPVRAQDGALPVAASGGGGAAAGPGPRSQTLRDGEGGAAAEPGPRSQTLRDGGGGAAAGPGPRSQTLRDGEGGAAAGRSQTLRQRGDRA